MIQDMKKTQSSENELGKSQISDLDVLSSSVKTCFCLEGLPIPFTVNPATWTLFFWYFCSPLNFKLYTSGRVVMLAEA